MNTAKTWLDTVLAGPEGCLAAPFIENHTSVPRAMHGLVPSSAVLIALI